MSAFRRFLSVGLINTLVGYFLILTGLWLGLGDYIANALGYGAGLALSYNLHRRWTFGTQTKSGVRQILRYLLSFGIAYSANLGVLTTARMLGYVDNPLAQGVAMAVYTVIFFILSRYTVFTNEQMPIDRK